MGSQPTVELFDVGMNRNGIHISATVFITEPGVVEPEDSYARIRKVTFVNDRVDKKEALKRDGTWVVVPEGEIYPEETHLPLMFIDTPERQSEAQLSMLEGFYGSIETISSSNDEP